MKETGNYYIINHVAMITGLTDRTIRTYIANGVLQGEKINGLWHFTPEQVECFIRHPMVRPSILAKNNSLVYDFLLDNKKKNAEMCIILDIPEGNKKEIAEFFCYHITEENYQNIYFAFDGVAENVRVILKGDTAVVLQLINEYYSKHAR